MPHPASRTAPADPRSTCHEPARRPPGGHGASGRQTSPTRYRWQQAPVIAVRHLHPAGDKMHLGPERLRAVIADTLAAGTFVVCHDTLTYGDFPDYGPAICRGFFDACARQSPTLILLQTYRRLIEVPPPAGSSLADPPA